jgi:uncharacterized protein YndB with AHSA1/START domain
VLPASREEVFDMWLNPDSLRRWMRPGDSVVVHAELEAMVGGRFRIDTQTDDGHIFVHTGQYLVIERPNRLVFTWHSTVLGDYPSQVTVEFHEQGENCLMTLQHELPPDDAIFEDHRNGWAAVLDLFAENQQANAR